ncbi:helix-turn-helix domain-containing protein [Rhodoferax ferrireducens]|uniref:helix-turn-helix domain-containing protein n=1 Tax=Rhodoferax ferrireducens TaxID=192843 RepID=UPI0018E56986|nr:helix-turn-helix domain-containing protein [Rhodoferax ferrireducens]
MARRLPETREAIDPQISDLAGLGAVVRNARAQSRLRIDDAAVFSAVSADMLSRLENGKPVTTDRLLKVLEGLGLEMLVVSKSQAWKFRDLALKASE